MITEQDYLTAERNGISRQHVRNRMYNYWDVQRAITEPVTPYKGLYKQYRQQCEKIGLSRKGFEKRVHSGMEPEDAATLPKGHSLVGGRTMKIFLTVEQYKKMRLEDGLTDMEIVEELGYCRYYKEPLQEWKKANGIPLGKSKFPLLDPNEVKNYFYSHSATETALKFGVSVNSLYRWIKKWSA